MTRLVTSVAAATLAELRAGIDRAIQAGAERIELRLDHLATEVSAAEVGDLIDTLGPGSWIATLRPSEEGGQCARPAEERWRFLLDATAGRRGHVDFEHQSRQVAAWSADPDSATTGRRWILSSHDFDGRPDDPRALAREIVGTGSDVIAKVAWAAQSTRDTLLAFEMMREFGDRVIVVVMGEAGLPSRVLAGKFGAAATYCAPAADAATAPGQVSLEQMLRTYRWASIRPSTRWFGVIGDPVRQSMGPVLFNRMFERAGVDAVYLPLLVAGGASELAALLEDCESRPWLDVGGFSVTLPHKQAARRFVGPRIEPAAARIGAVNTLVMRDGRFHGYNTDHVGALSALCAGLGCAREDLRGMSADVLGAGGAARAVVAGLTDCGCAVTIYNRTPEAAAALAEAFGCRTALWEERDRRRGRVVVNCTSVGMVPHVDAAPLEIDAFADQPVVFDTIYTPPNTRLLREAGQAGCTTIGGVEMFVRQAAAQYRLWFDQTPDIDAMRDIVTGQTICGE